MKPRKPIRYVIRGLVVLLMFYVAAAGLLATREDSIVFRGATFEAPRGLVPPITDGLPWDSLRIEADDGSRVFLLESTFADPAKVLWALFFHGNGGLVGSPSSVGRYELLREAGFNVLAVEFRGYGASAAAGPPSEDALYADARAGWRYLTGTLGISPDRVIVYGWSLGSALATHVAAESAPAAVVTEGAPTSLVDVGAARYPWFPVRWIMRSQFDNLERSMHVSSPWLILHGRWDVDVPFHHGQALADAARNGRLVPLNAGHDGVTVDRDVALGALRELAQQVATSASPR